MEDSPLRALATATCKCCGAAAKIFDVVDFNKNAEITRGREVLDLCGIPVYYHRCDDCGFIFTVAFDTFSPEEMAEFVYNDQYVLVDPDFVDRRPSVNAQSMVEIFGATRDLRILDYGGGNGLLARHLRDAGFTSVQTYDPFVAEHSTPPTGRFDLVVAFEVLEHTCDPRGTIEEMASLVSDSGLLMFSTLLQPPEIESIRLSWWYAAPRNGHVSLYSRESLARLVEPLGLAFGSASDNLHVLFRQIPDFATHLFRRAA